MVPEALQAKRDRFRQLKQHEMEVDVLKSTTEFVQSFLHDQSVWSFDDKDRNLLTYEVRSYDLLCGGYGSCDAVWGVT